MNVKRKLRLKMETEQFLSALMKITKTKTLEKRMRGTEKTIINPWSANCCSRFLKERWQFSTKAGK